MVEIIITRILLKGILCIKKIYNTYTRIIWI